MTIFCCKEIEFFLKENEVSISYDSSELLKCTVSFTYTRYLVERKKMPMCEN